MSWSSLTRRVISVGRIVVPSTALLYPACNNQARGGLGRGSIRLVEFPKFLLNGKRPRTTFKTGPEYSGRTKTKWSVPFAEPKFPEFWVKSDSEG